jgi:hypothetical protein
VGASQGAIFHPRMMPTGDAGQQVTRLSHAGHASFTRSPRARRKLTTKACAVITVDGTRQTVKLG